MYLAFQVAHLPVDAPADTLREYEGKYRLGSIKTRKI
jgi:hypothetical protein